MFPKSTQCFFAERNKTKITQAERKEIHSFVLWLFEESIASHHNLVKNDFVRADGRGIESEKKFCAERGLHQNQREKPFVLRRKNKLSINQIIKYVGSIRVKDFQNGMFFVICRLQKFQIKLFGQYFLSPNVIKLVVNYKLNPSYTDRTKGNFLSWPCWIDNYDNDKIMFRIIIRANGQGTRLKSSCLLLKRMDHDFLATDKIIFSITIFI